MNIAEVNVMLFEDVAKVFREVETKSADLSMTKTLSLTPVATVKGRLSIMSADKTNIKDDVNQINCTYKFFCGLNEDIKVGDVIEITKQGTSYKFISALPVNYKFHKETVLTIEGVANV